MARAPFDFVSKNRGAGSFLGRRVSTILLSWRRISTATIVCEATDFCHKGQKNLGFRWRPGKAITATIFCDQVAELKGQLS